ncbi:MAG: ATP-binding cassette domain-containing protein [Eubacteriales bacterium]|nr:ATP-binding cassette domain-containing protein [Eubacteriales bacterium]
MILSVSHLTKSYDGKDILRDVSFHLEERDRAAVTGVNGAGKSTLLKQITGEETPDQGSIVFPKDKTMACLSQNPHMEPGRNIYEEVLSVKASLIAMEEELRALEHRMQALSEGAASASASVSADADADSEKKAELDSVYQRYAELSHSFEEQGGYALKSNVTGILKGLGFSEADFSLPTEVLSGGQKTRLSLGKLLLSEPDLLLLDEPTNHLDIASIAWLESYLRSYRGTVIIVSHDRYFLDRIVTKVIDIENGSLRLYEGNYTAFAEKKAQLRKDMMKAYLNNQAEIRHQQEVIAKLKQFNREKSIKRAESREKMLAKIERVEKPFDVDDAMKLHFAPSHISGNDVLQAEGLSKAFDGKTLFTGVALDVKRGEKLAIIGPNGTGKTTLLKIIDGALTPDSGELRFGAKVELAYYDQEHHVLNPDNTVFEEISDTYPSMTNTEIRNLLAAFLFTGDDVFKEVRDLSGGEKGRLSLSKLMLSRANLLLLDEPTNHLDITSKEILEEAIRNYEGTVIYVSHDRYFINRTATRILELSEGSFVNYIGNYDYYLEKKADPDFDEKKALSGVESELSGRSGNAANQKRSAADEKAAALRDYMEREEANTKRNWQEQKERRTRLQKLRSELSGCEKEIERLEARDFELDDIMSHPEIATNSARLNELSAEKAELAEKLAKRYADWEAASEALEAFENEE